VSVVLNRKLGTQYISTMVEFRKVYCVLVLGSWNLLNELLTKCYPDAPYKVDDEGVTLLHRICRASSMLPWLNTPSNASVFREGVCLLVSRGVDVTARDCSGRLAADYLLPSLIPVFHDAVNETQQRLKQTDFGK
jgi:hypothetical protein